MEVYLVVTGAKLQKDFCGIYLFTDRKTGKGYSISLWDTEEDAVATSRVATIRSKLASLRITLQPLLFKRVMKFLFRRKQAILILVSAPYYTRSHQGLTKFLYLAVSYKR